jgi:hypothetical protein
MEPSSARENAATTAIVVVCVMVILAVVVGGFIGILSGYKSWHRAQQRADANNRVRVTQINIRTAQQQARVVAANDARVKALVSELRRAGVGDINLGGRHERLASAIAAWGEELAQLRINDPDPSHAERALEERRRKYLDGDDYEDRQ